MDYLSKLSYITRVTCTAFLLGFLPSITLAQNNDNNFELPAIQQPKSKNTDKKVAMEPVIASIPQDDKKENTTTSSIGTTQTGINMNNENLHYSIPNVNESRIQESWLSRVNDERATKGLEPLALDNNLIKSSIERSNYLGTNRILRNMHKRPGQKIYYSTETIVGRARDLGLIDDTISIIAESTMFGGYSCKLDDCTEAFINRTKGKTGGPSGFLGFLMGEKRYNGVHYKMMMSSNYTKVGFGFSLTKSSFGSTYIGVIHYGK